jgi:hypothetical protein
MQRPQLTVSLPPSKFRAWYWLKAELIAFCRSQRLRTSGSKQEIAARIEAHLGGKPAPAPGRKRSANAAMPTHFELRTVVGEGWRCSQELRRFFEHHCGAGFLFNGGLRDFIRTGAGRTLAEAIAHYERSVAAGSTEIGEQFEYNRHTREFFAKNPAATREQAIAAWWAKRGAVMRR